MLCYHTGKILVSLFWLVATATRGISTKLQCCSCLLLLFIAEKVAASSFSKHKS